MAAMSKGERIAREKLLQYLWLAETDNIDWRRVERHVPEAWHMIAHDIDVREVMEKVTLHLDASVAKISGRWGRAIRRASTGCWQPGHICRWLG